MTIYELEVPSRKLVRALSATVVGLLLVHVGLTVWHYQWQELPWLLRQLFDVDEENNLPTAISALALLITAGFLLLLGLRKRTQRDPWTPYWLVLALAFGLLSLDEIAGLHETYNSISRTSWGIPGATAAAGFGLVYLRFLRDLPSSTRWRFVAAGFLFVGGAVGVEMATDWYADEDLLDTLSYNLWTAVEEGLEMTGVLVFLHALLGYMRGTPSSSIGVGVEIGKP